MHVDYYERDDDVTLHVRKDRDEIRVQRHDEHVTLEVEGWCENIFARVKFCMTCREYERLVCEMERVECGHEPCHHCREEREVEIEERIEERIEVRAFDQDDCDEPEEKPKPAPKPRGKR